MQDQNCYWSEVASVLFIEWRMLDVGLKLTREPYLSRPRDCPSVRDSWERLEFDRDEGNTQAPWL